MELANRNERPTGISTAVIITFGAIGLAVGLRSLIGFLSAQFPDVHNAAYVSLVQATVLVSLIVFVLRQWGLAVQFPFVSQFGNAFKWIAYACALAVPIGFFGIETIQYAVDQIQIGHPDNAVFFAVVYVGVVWICYKSIRFADPINPVLCESLLALYGTCSTFLILGASFVIFGILLIIALRITWAFIKLLLPLLFLAS